MTAFRHHEDASAAAFERHAALARQERAEPALIDNEKFQRKRRRAYRKFLSAFTRDAA